MSGSTTEAIALFLLAGAGLTLLFWGVYAELVRQGRADEPERAEWAGPLRIVLSRGPWLALALACAGGGLLVGLRGELERPAVPAAQADAEGDATADNVLRTAQAMRASQRWDEAARSFEEAARRFAALRNRQAEADARAGLGDVEAARGRADQARAAYAAALEIYAALGDRYGEANVLAAVGALDVAAGRPDAARVALDRARSFYVERKVPQGEANTLLALGRLERTENPELARQYLTDAAKLYELVGLAEWQETAMREAEAIKP